MALVRILIDGYSLLHSWPELAPGRPRYSAAARDELIHRIRLYQDAVGTPITIVFDGANTPSSAPEIASTPELEILYSQAGQTADEIIERVTHRLRAYGEVLAVTNDNAERETVGSMGGMASSCENLIATVEDALQDLTHEIKHYNRRERSGFRKTNQP
jgi:uncharacterized protein